MTRPSRRELERAIERLDVEKPAGDGAGSGVVFETETGYIDEHGDPVSANGAGDPDVEPPAFGPVIVLDAEYVTQPIEGARGGG